MLGVGLVAIIWLFLGGWASVVLTDQDKKRDREGFVVACLIFAPILAGMALAELLRKPKP